tara:strand:- start:4351 stop:4938 length:588 start_codon:yes stop_codon:yes gene_type:complete
MCNFIIRTFDIIISVVAFILLFPIIFFVSIAVAFDLGFPIFFKQERLGLKGKKFTIFKFRSMKNEIINVDEYTKVNEYTIKVKDDPRISVVGKFIRNTSLDELPQLLNVLLGNMSIVGPRPFVPKEYENFPEDWYSRLNCKPGVTGLAQIRGRSDLPMEKIIESDNEWIEKRSPVVYFRILIGTLIFILKRKNVY